MKTILITLLVVSAAVAVAQQPVEFSLTNVVNGQTVSTNDFAGAEGLLVIFTSNACAYDEYYRQRIHTLAARYGSRIPVLLINASPDSEEAVALMKEKAGQLNLAVPYLADKDQKLMTQLGARKTPEAFLLRKTNGKFTVFYRGAIDDNPQVEADVRTHYLRDAIELMLKGQKPQTPEARAVGCNLRRK